MKNIPFSLSVVLIFILLFTACSPTNQETGNQSGEFFIPDQIPGEVIYIPYPVDVVLDGNLEDWNDLPFYFVDKGPLVPENPNENGSFHFSVAADLDNFYITMQMPDQNIIAGQHGTEFWNEDSMEFYINASDDLNATGYKTDIFQLNINAADIGNTDPESLTITGVFSTDVPVKGFVFKTDDGWGFEVAIPHQGIMKPEHGLEIGFQAQINGATSQDRDVKLIWSNADTDDNSWQYPYLFGRGIFFELGRDDIPEPSVLQVIPAAATTPAPDIIPAMVSLNQVGYYPSSMKIALLAHESTVPLSWMLINGDGENLLSGTTKVKGFDHTSGVHLHSIDFSEFSETGDHFKILIENLESADFKIAENLFQQLTKDAMAYFYHNRSGIPIDSGLVGELWSRPAGHISDNNVTCYQGKDAEGNTWPGCDYVLDVAGGWYDAGDFGKYVVNGGISVWTLLNLYEQYQDAFPDGSLTIPESANGISDLLDEARWEMEFLLSMQIPEGYDKASMVHHKIHDESWAPIPMQPPTEVNNDNNHEISGTGRYLFPPSTAATLNLAATAAQSARIWKDIDPQFSEKCLIAAEKAWEAALANPDLFYGNIPGQGGGNYDDADVRDEFYWAAAELFITTGNKDYEDFLINSDKFGLVEQFDWGHTGSLGTLSLLTVDNGLGESEKQILQTKLIDFAEDLLLLQQQDGYGVLLKGVYPWGSNGLIMNNLILMSVSHKLSGEQKYLDSVVQSMDYMLGKNPVNQSYVSGYGTYTMQHPHHRFWANDPANGFPPPPAGALSGGPNVNPEDPAANNANLQSLPESKRYIDDIGSYTTNEVTINWNAPFVWVLVYLNNNLK